MISPGGAHITEEGEARCSERIANVPLLLISELAADQPKMLRLRHTQALVNTKPSVQPPKLLCVNHQDYLSLKKHAQETSG